jgi:cell division septum initiation protein DivIVA
MNENMKFYTVQIGVRTRAGNLNNIHSFICQSDKSQYDIQNYYFNKYNGFGVNVSEITEIVTDINNEITPSSNNSNPLYQENNALKQKVKELTNSVSFSTFKGRVKWNKISTEVTENFRLLEKLSADYKSTKDNITKDIISFINNKYSQIDKEYTSLEEYSHKDDFVPFTTRLSGVITNTLNVIEE